MSDLIKFEQIDRDVYKQSIAGFLPDRIIDIHTHVYITKNTVPADKARKSRVVSWPDLVAKDDPIEDLCETYRLMLPGKTVIPLLFGSSGPDLDANNRYIAESATKTGFPSLLYARPEWSDTVVEEKVIAGGHIGCKVYLSLAASYIPEKEIRIFDYLPPHQLEVMNKHGWIVMLHIPRPGRLKDPVNLAQMLEIERRYPNIRLIIAHVGRAYCPEDVGDAFDVLCNTKRMVFDFSANTNDWVFNKLIQAVGPKRILFGSDMPVTRMRMRRICENGDYVNIVPKGLYGDLTGEAHMREAVPDDEKKITFFLYEEILAFKKAAEANHLTKFDIEDVFFNNAMRLINNARNGGIPEA